MNARTLLTLPYRIYRRPIATLDAQLADRMPKDSASVLIVERILGSYDQFAGRLLKDSSVARQGAERLERTRKITDAVALERRAAERRTEAGRAGETGEQTAAEMAEQAAVRLADSLDQADETERRGKQDAMQGARNTAASRKQAAEAKTSQRLHSVEQSVEQTESAADARAQRAQNTAKAKLDDVAEDRAEAQGKHKDAKQLDSLVDSKKNARTNR